MQPDPFELTQAKTAPRAEQDFADLKAAYHAVRRQTEQLIAPLSSEDACVQSMPDASPAKWHLGHTSWFFETVILRETRSPSGQPFQVFAEALGLIFNSYYNSVGAQYSRPHRGLLTRPSLTQVLEYREFVDHHMVALIESGPVEKFADLIELGLHHEMQHQELLLMDIKHLFSCNPLDPAYLNQAIETDRLDDHVAHSPSPCSFIEFAGGVQQIGAGPTGFAYDNERPRHDCLTQPFMLASRPVTNLEFVEFIADGGYRNPLLWLSDGFAEITRSGLNAPAYWRPVDGSTAHEAGVLGRLEAYREFTLAGVLPLEPDAPVSHLSFYEADAYARWVGARLPTEQEWELAARDAAIEGNFMEQRRLHPAPAWRTGRATDVAPAREYTTQSHATQPPEGTPWSSATQPHEGAPGQEPTSLTSPRDASTKPNLQQLFGDVWEWTASPYVGYPGFRPGSGTLAEYNGKFMSNQMVLRGGCCLTPRAQMRASYRNFFYPHTTWQCSGLRLARDLD